MPKAPTVDEFVVQWRKMKDALESRVQTRKVKAAVPAIHERPGYTFARHCDPDWPEHRVIFIGVLVMLELGREIAPAVLLP
jgi:hypothetical protein